MQQIEHDRLTKGLRVHYKYSGLPYAELSGPFDVEIVSGSHDGKHVILRDLTGEIRDVHIASDEYYGEPVFYIEKDEA